LVALLAIAIGLIAFVLYQLGFSVNKLKIKLGLIEIEADRKAVGGRKPSENSAPESPAGTKVEQRAARGGVIEKSGISAPANADAQITQHATGQKSKIDDSPIKLE